MTRFLGGEESPKLFCDCISPLGLRCFSTVARHSIAVLTCLPAGHCPRDGDHCFSTMPHPRSMTLSQGDEMVILARIALSYWRRSESSLMRPLGGVPTMQP